MIKLEDISALLLNPIFIGVVVAVVGYVVTKKYINSFLKLKKSLKDARKYVYRTAVYAQNFFRDPESYVVKKTT